MTKVSNCGHDENWGVSGGAAGDQTGNEWYVRDWYDFGQNVVLRHPDSKVRALIASMATEAAQNDAIGYDQGQRETFWQQLERCGYIPSKIGTRCEADCSSGTAAIVRAVGYRLGNDLLKQVPTWLYTGNMREYLVKAGFYTLTDSKYLRSGDYLSTGDINLNERTHVNITVTNGGKVGGDTSQYDDTTLEVDGWVGPATVSEWQRQCGTAVDGVVSGQLEEYAKYLPRLSSVTYDGTGSSLMLAVQKKVGVPNPCGVIGDGTVCMLQGWLTLKGHRCTDDNAGVFGEATAKALQESLNDKEWA